MPLEDVRPLQKGLPFGVRIGGLTREKLENKALRDEIDALFVKHGMIVFEDVEQSDEMQLALSSCFGPLKEHPVKGVSRVDGDRLPGVIEIRSKRGRGIVEVDGKQVSHWLAWHFEGKDIAYRLETQYDELKFGRPAQYRMIEPKPMPDSFKEQVATMSRAIHPAVWTRPTGEKCLHVSSYMAQGIVGDETPEGDALLEAVCQEINRLGESCSYHHKWRPNDMAIWDNLRMLHCVSGNNPEEERLMYRTTIAGDYGHGRWEEAPREAVVADAMA